MTMETMTGATSEHLDVVIIGAGLSGIGAAHHIQTACPWASYAIFEARDALGGTWDLFRYPGIRSDSDMYTLGYSFRPWDGEKSIADGDSILSYIQETAREGGIDQKIRYHHRITKAEWSSDDARWNLTAERSDTGETVELTAGFVFSCTGYYRYDRGHQPVFDGADQFNGTFVYPQSWPEDLDYSDKQVVVIGSGATAITLVPSMAQGAAHVTMLQRSPTYVASLPAKDPIAGLLNRVLPERVAGSAIRWFKALATQASYKFARRFPKAMKKMLRKVAAKQLPEGFDVDTHFGPNYNPWDQRLCVVPDGDLFAAISAGSVSVLTDTVDTFTADGIRLTSGTQLPADIVVSATGLELLFLGGIDLRVDGEEVHLPNKLTYKGMMLEGVPNMAMAIGYTNASWTLKCDLTCQYVTRLLNHMHHTGQRQCTPVNTDATVTGAPLLGLTAGYVQRSTHLFPKQGNAFPWQVHQSYLKDYRALKMSDIHDGVMEFSNRANGRAERSAEPTREPVGAVAGGSEQS